MKEKNETGQFPDSIPDAHIASAKTAHLVKAYEKLNLVPEKERIFSESDTNIVDMSRLRSIYSQALSIIERSSDDFQNVKVFSDEQRVMNFIRGCMIAKTLKDGDLVVIVPMCPFDDKGNISLDIKPVAWMEPERNLCGVGKKGDFFMPISNILARYDELLESTAFGIPHSELLYLEHESEALPLLRAAYEQYNNITNSLDVITDAFDKAGLLPKNDQHTPTVCLAKKSVLDKIRKANNAPQKPKKDKLTRKKNEPEL